MNTKEQLFLHIEDTIKSLLNPKASLDEESWKKLLRIHPADLASLLARLQGIDQIVFLEKIPVELAAAIFENSSESLQTSLLVRFNIETATNILNVMSGKGITDLLETLSDNDLKKYLGLLQQKKRSRVSSLLTYEPDSAGGTMHTDVITLFDDITIRQAANLLRRATPTRKHVNKCIFVTNHDNKLLGYINLDALVLSEPETKISTILKDNIVVFNIKDDKEHVAKQMHHYKLTVSPVTDTNNNFLGIITADDVFDILEDEASEDVYKLSGLSPVEHSYFDTPFWQLIKQRGPWLVGLLLLQSISSMILTKYDALLAQYTIIPIFLTMLIGTGGNAGNQSGAIVVRGLATGEVGRENSWKVLLRELSIATVMAAILSAFAFMRVYTHPNSDVLSALTISASLFIIVIVSTLLGTALPLVLERFNFDPAHSAAPFLSTLMDIIGIMIYCAVCSKMLGF